MIRRPHVTLLAVIALGGALGSLARFGFAEALPAQATAEGWATVAVNITGSLALGLLTAYVVTRRHAPRLLHPFLGVGFLGGFTTFSTAMADLHPGLTHTLHPAGPLSPLGLPAVLGVGAYLALSVIGSLLAALLALRWGQRRWAPAPGQIR